MPKKNLLENVQKMVGCFFMSDLHMPGRLSDVQKAVDRIPSDLYSLDEWNELIYYVTGTSCPHRSAEEAKEYLISVKVN